MQRKLDLRTGKTVWEAYPAPRIGASRLSRDIRTEVLVVGMGISGAMVAEQLTAAGHEVAMVDRRGPLKGSTAATTALVQSEIDTPLSQLSRKIGTADAIRAWRRSRLAVANLEGRIEELGIDCGLARRTSLYLAGDVLTATALEEEAQARRAAGLPATYLDAGRMAERVGIRRAAILSDGNLAVDPRRLAAGLLKLARSRGARFHAPVEATGFAHHGAGVDVATRAGPVIRAGHVVLATGYELADPVPRDGHRVISTFAIATKPQKRNVWPTAAFLWEASDPYLYARSTDDGRIICGGEDEEFQDEAARDALLPDKAERIAAKLKALLPRVDPRPEFAWAGSFGTTPTGLPIIGAVPRMPRITAILGYGGNGITYSRIAAELVASRLAGKTDADADLYGFGA